MCFSCPTRVTVGLKIFLQSEHLNLSATSSANESNSESCSRRLALISTTTANLKIADF